MKYAKVSREGVYEKPPHAKFNYTTMIMVRTGFIVSSFTVHFYFLFYFLISKNLNWISLTIEFRTLQKLLQFLYVIVVFEDKVVQMQALLSFKLLIIKPNNMDYFLYLHSLIHFILQVFSLILYFYKFNKIKFNSNFFLGRYLREFYKKFANRTDTNDFSILPELHASSAGLKALTSDVFIFFFFSHFMNQSNSIQFKKKLVWHGIEICRQYCGGHGFHRFSGLPDLLVDFLPQVTGEGVNNVLYLQTSRYFFFILFYFFKKNHD